jgi:hypothetical protein
VTDQTSLQTKSSDARHFVVEVDGPNGRAFAICEQVMLIEGDQQELGVSALSRFVSDNALSAAPLAGEKASAWLMSATTAQSADDDGDDDEDEK